MDCCFARAFAGLYVEIEIRRPGRGPYVKGRWQTQNQKALKVKAVVQPLRPEEVLRLEDSRHVQEALKLYSETELFPVDVDDKREPDVVVFDGREFEVESVANWEAFFKTIAVRRERP